MILSFHPWFNADRFMLCAGRDPGPEEAKAISRADAVILPQGCRKSLFELAVSRCAHVFPNYRMRFQYPGKINQIRLFRKTATPHPETQLYRDTGTYCCSRKHTGGLDFPLVFKLTCGDEGRTVFWVPTATELESCLNRARTWEKGGIRGFLLQRFIPSGQRAARVVVIGEQFLPYWRVQPEAGRFSANLNLGARIDAETDPELLTLACDRVRSFCRATGIDLAGIDLLFPEQDPSNPVFLEINYYFGRRGLGGADRFRQLLTEALRRWADSRGLSFTP